MNNFFLFSALFLLSLPAMAHPDMAGDGPSGYLFVWSLVLWCAFVDIHDGFKKSPSHGWKALFLSAAVCLAGVLSSFVFSILAFICMIGFLYFCYALATGKL